MKDKNKPNDKIIKAIKIFEVGGNYSYDGQEILDNVSRCRVF